MCGQLSGLTESQFSCCTEKHLYLVVFVCLKHILKNKEKKILGWDTVSEYIKENKWAYYKISITDRLFS